MKTSVLPTQNNTGSLTHPFFSQNFFDRMFEPYFRLNLFDHVRDEERKRNGQTFQPRIDVQEKEGEYLLKADIPGVSKDDIHLEVSNGILYLSGEKKEERKDATCHVLERRFGSFKRSMTLPEDVDTNHIEASHKNGVLTVHLQKKPENKGKRTIEIERS